MAAIIEPCVGTILYFLVKPIIMHVASATRYKSQLQQLEQENERLREKKERIRRMVDIATNNGKVILTEVSSWLQEVEQMEGDINQFLHQEEDREFFRCFSGCMCPNLIWRSKRGTEADRKKLDVSELIREGERLERWPVAYDAPSQWEPLFDSSMYYTAFQSRASVVDEIKNALEDSRANMIGLHGPGGVGKTTMVKEVAKEAKELGIFDKIVIAIVSKDPNTSKLQEELAFQLDFKYEQRSELGRADELRKALLNGKRNILVIFDDIWQGLDLNAIGIPTSGLGNKGCKILLTSRNEEVFKRMQVHLCFSIGYLEDQEAWELFRKVIGDFEVNEPIARNVSKRCGGLPIAIVAVGAALRGEEKAEWQDALYQLENFPLKYIEGIDPMGYTPLKWSYNFLKDEDAKSCFLLCCLFPEDAEISIDDLVRYSFALGFLGKVDTLKRARNRVQAMVNMLKRSCLLLNGKNKNFIRMHDVIRDLAISITKEKPAEHGDGHDWPGQQQFIVDHNIQKWPKNDAWEHHTAISLRTKHNIHFPYGVLHCPLMLILVLEPYKGYPLQIPNDFFQGMKKARVLDLKGISTNLPSSFLELDHLRMLRLNNCYRFQKRGLSTIQNLRNHIEILSFEGSMIEELPQEIGKLTYLRSLDLRECKRLRVIPKGVISNLIHLEELYVAHNFKKWDTTIDGGGMSNASIAELKSLTQLTVLHVGISTKSYKIMAQECRDLFQNLISFSIFINSGSFFGNESLNVLEIFDVHNTRDEFRLLMDRVETLRLSDIQDLRYLCGEPQPPFTPSGGRSFCRLTYLDISRCHSMKYLFSPPYAKSFQQLKTLVVSDCNRMEQIIGTEDYCDEEEAITDEAIVFSRLKMISLSKLLQFRSFCLKMEKTRIEGNPSNCTTIAESIFNEKVSFPSLEELTIDELSVEDIWNKQMIHSPKGPNEESFCLLKNMEVTHCDNLVNVFPSNMLPRLQNLERLCVRDCLSLTLLVEDLNPDIQSPTTKFKFVDVFPKLRYLHLDDLHKLMKIWLNDENYCSYENSVHLYLKTILITNCHGLRHMFSAFVARHLVSIECLSVQECRGMEVIVSEATGEEVIDDGIITFRQLKKLELVDLPNLKSFYQSKSEASHLFNHQVTFSKIESLRLIGLYSSREIQLWDLLVTTREHLRIVIIIRCQVSTKVSSHHQRQSCRTMDLLRLQNCQGFKYVIDLNGAISIGKEQFANMKNLELYNLPELVLLWNKSLHEIGGLRNLKEITIIKCSQLRSLFTHFMATTLQHLEILSVRSCEMLEEIIIIEENDINFAGKEKEAHHTEFPKLKKLILDDLPKLKNFCKDEKCSINFSSLRKIEVLSCPEMKTFTSGKICLPPGIIRTFIGNELVEITDLNAAFEDRNEVDDNKNGDNNYMVKTIYWGDDSNFYISSEDDFDVDNAKLY